jgi:hypothetical protein
MALNTKRKDLGRSKLSSIFGSRLKLSKMVFFDKNSIMFAGTICLRNLSVSIFFIYDFNSFLGVKKKISSQIFGPSGSAIDAGGS